VMCRPWWRPSGSHAADAAMFIAGSAGGAGGGCSSRA
jgi:hypothetical protein